MSVMVLVKPSKDSEARVMPTQQMWTQMDQFTEGLIKAGIMSALGEGLQPSSKGVRVRFSGQERRTPLVKLLDKLSRFSKEAFHVDFP